jgi:hypothetical protein
MPFGKTDVFAKNEHAVSVEDVEPAPASPSYQRQGMVAIKLVTSRHGMDSRGTALWIAVAI